MWSCLRKDLKKHSVRIRHGFEKTNYNNFFKPCNKEKLSTETFKSSDLSLMDQVNLQTNVVCNFSDKPFHPSKNFKFPDQRFGKETFNRLCQSQQFEDHQWLHYDVGREVYFGMFVKIVMISYNYKPNGGKRLHLSQLDSTIGRKHQRRSKSIKIRFVIKLL